MRRPRSVKSSSCRLLVPGAAGIFSGRTNSPISPVLPISRGGACSGAGSALPQHRSRFGCQPQRSVGSVTSFSRLMILRSPRAAPVVRQDRFADELFLLEVADHVTIVRRLQATRLGDDRRQPLHLALDLGKGLPRHRRERLGLQRDTDLFERKGVEVRRQSEVCARLGQNLRADEFLVIQELLLQCRKRFAPAFNIVLVEELLEALYDQAVRDRVRPGTSPGEGAPPSSGRRASAASPER